MDAAPKEVERSESPSGEALLHLEGITKVYTTGDVELRALDGVSLTIGAGEFVAIMGSSGSGKSTLMNILGCLDRPTAGTYVLAGRDVSKLDKNELAEVRNVYLGFVFQSFNLLARTSAVENVELPLLYAGVTGKARRERAVEALQRVGLGQRLEHHPSQLSGGQQQRVAIARALVSRPRLILADEPTGNLDSKTTVEIMALLQALGRSGITIVFVTHEPDVAAYASRVIVVRDGRIQSDTTQTPVVATPEAAAPEPAKKNEEARA
ncbi:MAG: ABC transporter ATP-binding protein [Polyangiaceae bacterium]